MALETELVGPALLNCEAWVALSAPGRRVTGRAVGSTGLAEERLSQVVAMNALATPIRVEETALDAVGKGRAGHTLTPPVQVVVGGSAALITGLIKVTAGAQLAAATGECVTRIANSADCRVGGSALSTFDAAYPKAGSSCPHSVATFTGQTGS